MDWTPISRWLGNLDAAVTPLLPPETLDRTPLLGTVLYDDASDWRCIRPYRPLHADFPAIQAYGIADAWLTDAAIVHRGRELFLDASLIFQQTLSGGGDMGEACAAGTVYFTAGIAAVQRRDESHAETMALVIHNEGGGTWGHFLLQAVPRALLFLRHFPGAKIALPWQYCQPGQNNFASALFELGITPDRLVPLEPQVSYRFGRLVLVDMLYDLSQQIPHPAALALLSEAAGEPDPAAPERAIFIERAPWAARAIANADDTRTLLARFGMPALTLGEVSFRDQVQAWRQSRLVVATLGSDLSNIVFGRPGTRLLALSPHWFGDNFFYNLAVVKGMQWNELRCGRLVEAVADIQHRSSFVVDLDILHVMASGLTR
jgi:hypothetical protein